LIEAVIGIFVSTAAEAHADEIPIAIEIVEFVHLFLIGTVLYITAVGLYQLFIEEVEFHGWLKIDSTEEVEMNLIGVTVIVLAVSFLGIAFSRHPSDLLEYGVGIALPIAALAFFVGMRAWSTRGERARSEPAEGTSSSASKSQEESRDRRRRLASRREGHETPGAKGPSRTDLFAIPQWSVVEYRHLYGGTLERQ
jgi:uncharacterized membrane protein YqhA